MGRNIREARGTRMAELRYLAPHSLDEAISAFAAGGNTGDVIPLDLRALVPNGANYQLVGFDFVGANGASATRLDLPAGQPQSGHLQLSYQGRVALGVVFSDRTQGTNHPFSTSGQGSIT